MTVWKKAFALVMLTALPMSGYSNCAQPETWSGATSAAWNVATNWNPNCVPGSISTNTDTATFGSVVGGFGSTITLPGFDVGLSQLVFDNSSTSYTLTGANAVRFNGASLSPTTLQVLTGNHVINAPVKAIDTTLNITIFDPNGSLTFEKAVTGAGSAIVFNGPGQLINLNNTNGINVLNNITVMSGVLTNRNTANIAVGISGSLIDPSGDLVLNGGTVNNVNVGTMSSPGAIGAQLVPSDFIINNGILNNVNNGSAIVFNSTGSQLNAAVVDFTINGGTVINSNTGSATNGGVGAEILIPETLTINGGTLTNTNSGVVSLGGSIGSFINVQTNPVVMNGGTWTNVNSSDISTNAIGAKISMTGFTMNGGTFTNLNTGAISGAGIGSLILVTGPTTINGGTFINNDQFKGPSITVGGSGKLAGTTGIFVDPAFAQTLVLTNSGTVTPRSTGGGPAAAGVPGKMNILGNYTQTPTGTLVINFASPTSSSELNATSPNPAFGQVHLDGTLVLAVSPGGSFLPGQSFNIVKGHNGLTGNFRNIINFNMPNLIPHFVVSADPTLMVSFTPTLDPTKIMRNLHFVLFSLNNQRNLRILDKLIRLNDRIAHHAVAENKALSTSPTSRFFSPRQRNIRGAPFAIDTQQFTTNTSFAAPLNLNEHVLLADGEETKQKQQQLIEVIQVPPIPNPLNIYFGPTGGIGKAPSKKGQTGFTTWNAGATIGLDYAFNQFGLGAVADYTHSHENLKHDGGESQTDSATLNVYGSYVPQSLSNFAVNAITGGSYNWLKTPRDTGVGSMSLTAKGKPFGAEYNALLGVQYTLQNDLIEPFPDSFQIIPGANLQYLYSFTSKFREHHAGLFDLKFASESNKSLLLTLGTQVVYTWHWENATFSPKLDLGWQRQFLDKGNVNLSEPVFFDEPPVRIRGIGMGRNYAVVGLDLVAHFYDRYGIEASYNFIWNTLMQDHSFLLEALFRF